MPIVQLIPTPDALEHPVSTTHHRAMAHVIAAWFKTRSGDDVSVELALAVLESSCGGPGEYDYNWIRSTEFGVQYLRVALRDAGINAPPPQVEKVCKIIALSHPFMALTVDGRIPAHRENQDYVLIPEGEEFEGELIPAAQIQEQAIDWVNLTIALPGTTRVRVHGREVMIDVSQMEKALEQYGGVDARWDKVLDAAAAAGRPADLREVCGVILHHGRYGKLVHNDPMLALQAIAQPDRAGFDCRDMEMIVHAAHNAWREYKNPFVVVQHTSVHGGGTTTTAGSGFSEALVTQSTPIVLQRPLTQDEIHELTMLCLQHQITRKSLLEGMHIGYTASLTVSSRPMDQHCLDLNAMNSLSGPLTDGSVPLAIWLGNLRRQLLFKGVALERLKSILDGVTTARASNQSIHRLNDKQILELVTASIECRLYDDRPIMLSAFPYGITARLPQKGSPGQQIRADIETLNAMMHQGKNALCAWLSKAIDRAQYRCADDHLRTVFAYYHGVLE